MVTIMVEDVVEGLIEKHIEVSAETLQSAMNRFLRAHPLKFDWHIQIAERKFGIEMTRFQVAMIYLQGFSTVFAPLDQAETYWPKTVQSFIDEFACPYGE